MQSAADAETTRALAFNQGFYNLFLDVATLLGVVLVAVGHRRRVSPSPSPARGCCSPQPSCWSSPTAPSSVPPPLRARRRCSP
ncbi:DUF1304 family protein [Microbacterium sp. OR16]|uniref:DUF1304 family protein n=1 Tax=Microbacterium sp. OR16 TaxID=3095345 RepID=UPI0039B612FC